MLSFTRPVGNRALQAVGVAAELKQPGERGVVARSVGDGSTQYGEYLKAVAEAARECLPVLSLTEDNR